MSLSRRNAASESEKKGLRMIVSFTRQSLLYRLNSIFLKKFFTEIGISRRFGRIIIAIFFQ